MPDRPMTESTGRLIVALLALIAAGVFLGGEQTRGLGVVAVGALVVLGLLLLLNLVVTVFFGLFVRGGPEEGSPVSTTEPNTDSPQH
jgi:hypothetical protein